MSPKNSVPKLNPKRMFSAIMCLLIALMFFFSLVFYDFSISRLLFGLLSLYFSISFFRSAKE